MNALDLALIAIILVSLLYSTWRGFVRDAMSLVGILGGFFFAFRFYSVAAQWIIRWIPKPLTADLLGWLLIFALVYLAASIFGRMLRGSIRLLHLGWFDRMAGFFLGGVKGILICAGVLVVLLTFFPSETPLLAGSRLAPYVIGISWELGSLVPGHIGERFRDGTPPLEGMENERDAGSGG